MMMEQSEEGSLVRSENGTTGVGVGRGENDEGERAGSCGDIFSASREQCEEIQVLKRRLEAVEEELNENKKKVKILQDANLNRETEVNALTMTLRNAEAREKELIAKNESLRFVSEYVKKNGIVLGGNTPKGKVKGVKDIPDKYIGIFVDIKECLAKFSTMEVFEVHLVNDNFHRMWEQRGTAVDRLGVKTRNGEMIVPMSPMKVASEGQFHTPSFFHARTYVGRLVENVLEDRKWSEVNGCEVRKATTVTEVGDCKSIQNCVVGNISNVSSYLKRVIRDSLFGVLHYDKLTTKYYCKTDEDKARRTEQAKKAQNKLMKKREEDGEYDMSWWRTCTDVNLLSCDVESSMPMNTGSEARTESEDIRQVGSNLDLGGDDRAEESRAASEEDNEETETYKLFRNRAGSTVWKCLLRTLQTHGGEGSYGMTSTVDCSIVLLARVDAWIMTVLDCLSTDGKRGGGRQKEYLAKFEKYVKVAMEQITQSLYEYVKEWEPHDFELTEEMEEMESGSGITEGHLEAIERKKYNATQPVFDTYGEKIYLAISKEWFMEYVGSELGEVVDAYVAEYSTVEKKIVGLVWKDNE